MVWAHCTAAHADAPPARALARGGSRYHHRPTSPPRVVAVALLLAPIHFLLLSLFTSIRLAVWSSENILQNMHVRGKSGFEFSADYLLLTVFQDSGLDG